jgi:putative flippase GtrA
MVNDRNTYEGVRDAYPAAPEVETSASTPGDRATPLRGESRSRLGGQVARFAVVGVLNTIVDYGLFNLLGYGLHMNLVLAQAIGVTAGIVNSFLWNKLWTFRSRGWGEWRRELTAFLLVSGVGFAINVGGFALLHSTFGASSWVIGNLEKASTTVLSMVWNFIGYRFFAFRAHVHREA